MARFVFSFLDAGRALPENEGIEFPDAYAARREALRVIRDLLDKRSGALPAEWKAWSVVIRDSDGVTVLELPFAAGARLAAQQHASDATRSVASEARSPVVSLALARARRHFADLRKQTRATLRDTKALIAQQRRAAQELRMQIEAARDSILDAQFLRGRAHDQRAQPCELSAPPQN